MSDNISRLADLVSNELSRDEFARLLYFRFRLSLPGEGTYRDQVEALARTAEKQKWLPFLVSEIREQKPRSANASSLYRSVAKELFREMGTTNVEEARLEDYERFGLATSILLNRANTPLRTTTFADHGLESEIRPSVPFLDIVKWRRQLLSMEFRVCRVEPLNGTGFLVGPDLVLTNHHVFDKVFDRKVSFSKVRCRFDFKELEDGSVTDGVTVKLHSGEWLIAKSPPTDAERQNKPEAELPTVDELDFALVRLERDIGDEDMTSEAGNSRKRGWVSVPPSQPALMEDSAIQILQHPEGGPLQMVIDTQSVMKENENGTRVQYSANTRGGSSGSPVFDFHWKLLAIHHYGDPGNTFNQGIPIGTIRDYLQRNGFSDCLPA